MHPIHQNRRALNATERERDASGIAKATVTVPAIITRAYAKLMFPEGEPLGKTFEDEDGDRWQVIGVVEHFYNPYAWKIGARRSRPLNVDIPLFGEKGSDARTHARTRA